MNQDIQGELRAARFFRSQLPAWRHRVASWRANMPNPTKQPIWHYLAEAYLRRLEVVICAIEIGSPSSLPDDTWAQLRTLAEAMGMQAKRTHVDNHALSEELKDAGYPPWQVDKMLATPRKRGPSKGPREGANPPMNPKQVIEALEMRLIAGKTDNQIADHFCPSNCADRRSKDPKHGLHSVCANNVNKRVAQIERILLEMPIA